MNHDASSAYRVNASHSAGPVRLVIMLYEQLIKDLQRALTAMDKKNIEARTFELNHAISVVGQLQGTLDKEEGGEVAQYLDRFYWQLRVALMEAQIRISPEILHKQITHLLELREAWVEVERVNQESLQQSMPNKPFPQLLEQKGLGWST